MLKHTTLIFTIAISISITSQEVLNTAQAMEYINSTIERNLGSVFVLQKTFEMKDGKVSSFTSKNTKVDDEHSTHAFAVSLNNVGSKIQIKFFKAARNDIIKVVDTFDKEDWEVQQNAVIKLIREITSKMTEEDFVSNLHFFIIQDVRTQLAKSIVGDKDLVLKKVVIDDGMRYEIYNRESLLASVDIKIVEKVSDFYMNIVVNVSRQKKETGEFDIKMITRNPEDFNETMAKILTMLNFKDYFNTNEGNYKKIKEFFENQPDFKFMSLPNDEVKNDDGSVEKKFNLKFENDIIPCSVVYIPPKELFNAASYIFKMMINGKQVEFPPYHNMLNSELLKYIEGLGIRDHFKSVKESIFEIFKEKYNKYYLPKSKDSILQENSKNGVMGPKQYIYEAKKGNALVAYIIYTDTNGKISLTIETKKGLEVAFNYDFKKDNFKRSIIEDIIDFLMKSGAAKIKEEVL